MAALPDPQDVFMHNMLSEFEFEFERFLMSDKTEIIFADGFNGCKQKFAHIIYQHLKKAYKLDDNKTEHEFVIDPNNIPPMDGLLLLMFQNSEELKCRIKYIKAANVPFAIDTIKPPPIARVELIFIRI